MRQLNFLLFFAVCLALALFSIENTQIAAINVIPGVQLEAPLSIELLLAAGTGAMLAWLFSLWDQLQRQLDSWRTKKELKTKEKKIEDLEKALAKLQEEPDQVDLDEDDLPTLSEAIDPSIDSLEKPILETQTDRKTEAIGETIELKPAED